MANSLLQPVLDAVNAYRQDQESLEQLVHVASQQLGEDWLNALQTLPDSIGVDPEQKADMVAKIGHAVQYYNALTAWQMAEGFLNAQTPDITAIEDNLPAMEYWLSSFGDAGTNLLNQVKSLIPSQPVEPRSMGLPTPTEGYDEAMDSLMADLKEYETASNVSDSFVDDNVFNETPVIDEVPLDEALNEAYATRTEPIGVPQQALTEEQILAPEIVAQERLEAVQAQDFAEEQALAAEVLEQDNDVEQLTSSDAEVDFSDIDFSIFENLENPSEQAENNVPDITPMQEDVPVLSEDVLSSYVPYQDTGSIETVVEEMPIEKPRTIIAGNPEDNSFVTNNLAVQNTSFAENVSVNDVAVEESVPFPSVLAENIDETAPIIEEEVAIQETVSEQVVFEKEHREEQYEKPLYAAEGVSYDIPFEIAHFLREKALYEGMDAWISSRCVNLNKIEKTEYPYYGVLVDLMQSVVKDCNELLSRTDLGPSIEMWIAGGRRELTRLHVALSELISSQEDMYKTSLEDLLDPDKMREVLGKLDLSNRKEKREPAPDGFELVDDPFSSESAAEMEEKFKNEVGSAIG